jgi:hypothetical protein
MGRLAWSVSDPYIVLGWIKLVRLFRLHVSGRIFSVLVRFFLFGSSFFSWIRFCFENHVSYLTWVKKIIARIRSSHRSDRVFFGRPNWLCRMAMIRFVVSLPRGLTFICALIVSSSSSSCGLVFPASDQDWVYSQYIICLLHRF